MGLFGRSSDAYEQPRRGIPIRMIIGLIIAGIAFFSYYMRTEINPVTGEKQHIAMSTDQEIAMGLRAAPEMAAQMGGEAARTEADAAFVSSIGRKLAENSDARKSPYKFDFHLLKDTKTINAFALPGGQIFITRGLLNQLETEAQVAGVLGHEIGHVINRHAAEHMASGQLGQTLVAAVGVAASDERGRGTDAAMAAMVASQMLQLKYGRADEVESDQFGLKYMAQAGYDPSAMLGVMNVLAKAGKGNRQPEFLASHPHPEARLEKIKEYLKTNYPNGVPGSLSQGRTLSSISAAR